MYVSDRPLYLLFDAIFSPVYSKSVILNEYLGVTLTKLRPVLLNVSFPDGFGILTTEATSTEEATHS